MHLGLRALVFWLTSAIIAAGISAVQVFILYPVDPQRGSGLAPFAETVWIYALLALPAALSHLGAVSTLRRVTERTTKASKVLGSILSAVAFEATLYMLPPHLFSNGVALILLVCAVPFAVSLIVLGVASRLHGHSLEGAA